MKTRAQTLLQARKRDRQARKTVLKIPIAIAIPIPVSESGSSSVGPGEPREKRKGLPANMPPKGKKHATLLKQEIQPRSVGTSCSSTDLNSSVNSASLASVAGTMHGWKPDEQILLGLMKKPNMVQHYHCSKTKFYKQAALLMNVVAHRQIGRKVEKMVKSLKKHFDADEPGDVGITREEFNSLISGPATTGSCSKSSSKSASKTGGKKYTVPKNYDTSLVYLREKGATHDEYYDYIRVLKDDAVLSGFTRLKFYAERKEFIDAMVKRLLKSPEAAPPGPCATNYADDMFPLGF